MVAKKTDQGVKILVGFSKKATKRKWEVEFDTRTGRITHIVQHESHLITPMTLLHPGGISSGSAMLQNWLGGKWKQRDKEGNE